MSSLQSQRSQEAGCRCLLQLSGFTQITSDKSMSRVSKTKYMTHHSLPSPGGKMIFPYKADQVRMWPTSRTRCPGWKNSVIYRSMLPNSHPVLTCGPKDDCRNHFKPRAVTKEPGSHKLVQVGTSTLALSAHRILHSQSDKW